MKKSSKIIIIVLGLILLFFVIFQITLAQNINALTATLIK